MSDDTNIDKKESVGHDKDGKAEAGSGPQTDGQKHEEGKAEAKETNEAMFCTNFLHKSRCSFMLPVSSLLHPILMTTFQRR